MKKKLSDMTLEELWQLFPIILTEHQPHWARWYEEEAAALRSFLPDCTPHHIGSTRIPDIQAKPIVDILLEVPEKMSMEQIKTALIAHGWLCMSESPARVSFNKGYTLEGFAERVFHLHACRPGDCDEIYFRDYLLAHPETAREYEQLKLSLQQPYRHDRDGYTNAKTDFVAQVTAQAKRA